MHAPNSSGIARPKHRAPPNACDCHVHIYDAGRFPPPRRQARMQSNALVSDYRLLQKRIGTSRVVVVTPAAYMTDNEVTLDAIAKLGPQARGIAVVHPDVTDVALKRMASGGIRGIRFTQFDPASASTTIDMIEPLAKRVEPLGWHLQLHLRADQIAAAMLLRLPGRLVLDHLGRLLPPQGLAHPAYGIIRRLLDRGRTWIKLSGAYMFGPPPYAEATEVARAYVGVAPERLVWGSDGPHPTETQKPDDAVLFDLLSAWAPDERVRHRILVENPAALYGF